MPAAAGRAVSEERSGSRAWERGHGGGGGGRGREGLGAGVQDRAGRFTDASHSAPPRLDGQPRPLPQD